MSRRPPNPNVERAAKNQQTLKTLVKLESNKSCADCKRNKHPRWASWNLGVFICIRCSGVHRGMGTHISRVKSVDLDAWTDEQMQNMLRWGNARANKYWESKLSPGHVPSEDKIQNFIRTKYDSKRWVMDGGMPDPSTLDTEADDEIPLNVVQEKAKLDQSASRRIPSTNVPPPQDQTSNPDIDLFGDSIGPPASNAAALSKPPPTPPKPEPPSQRPAKAGESLLGFDFFGDSQSNTQARPSSAASSIASNNATSRPDLKQSILSLYSSNPRSTTPNQASQQGGTAAAKPPPTQGGFGSLESDFSSLNFGSAAPTAPRPSSTQQSSAFAAPPVPKATSPPQQSFGGNFFDSKPVMTATSPPAAASSTSRPVGQRGMSTTSGFGDFESAASPGVGSNNKPLSNSNALGDMFDFSSTSPVSEKAPAAMPTSNIRDSPFNISSAPAQPSPPKASTNPAPVATSAALMNMDPWGSNDAWASSTSASAMPAASPPPKASATVSSSANDWGWGGASTGQSMHSSSGFGSSAGGGSRITADEDFGGWESSAMASPIQQSRPAEIPQQQQPPPPPKPMGGFNAGGDDLFSNVWE